MGKSFNWFGSSMKSKDSVVYLNKRYKELKGKGYSVEQIENMLRFEIGVSTVLRLQFESISAGLCMDAGQLVGTEIGATAGTAFGGLSGLGIGSTIGGISGAGLGLYTCNKIIKLASESAVKSLSEEVVRQGKSFDDIDLDLNYVSTVLNKKSVQKPTLSPEKAIKNYTKPKNITLKTGIQKNVFLQPEKLSSNKDLLVQDTLNIEQDSMKSYLKPLDQYEIKAEILRELKSPQEEKLLKVHQLIQNPKNNKEEVLFDEKKDYSSYLNEVTKSNKIFTQEDLDSMSEDKLSENQEAIEYQKSTIGIPTNNQAKNSGMVFVEGYTRADGTPVKSYYRSR